MFSSACLNLPIGMRMHNIGRSVKSRALLQPAANLCGSGGASFRVLSGSALLRPPTPVAAYASLLLRGFATGTRPLGKSQPAALAAHQDDSFSSATHEAHKATQAAPANATGALGRTVREDWMVNLGRNGDDAWLTGPRPRAWWTGPHPSTCPGRSSADGRLRSLAQPHLGRQTRQSAQAYFDNGWCLTETLFAGLKGEEGFYRPPPHGLRHPQIFYYGHTPCLYVNKLRVAGILDKPVDPYLESIFEVGVDEMLWDDMAKNDMVWPTVAEVTKYRKQVYDKVSEVIAEHPLLAAAPTFAPPVDQQSPLWALYMAFEHERIHLETSSVLFRETPLHLVQPPEAWPALHPTARMAPAAAAAATSTAGGSSSGGHASSGAGGGWCGFRPNTNPQVDAHFPRNAMLPVAGRTVTVGKPESVPSFGWDNEYGAKAVAVAPFSASKHLVSNGEFFAFVRSGGYREAKFWSRDGWAWRTHRNLKAPFFWQPDGPAGSHAYKLRTVFEVVDMPWAWPAEVTYHEAKAFGAWQAHRDGLLPDSSAAYRMLTEAEHHCLRDESQPDRVLWCPGEHFADPHASSGTATAAAHASGDVASNADAVYEEVSAASPGGGSGGGGAANSNLAFGSCSPVDALEPSRSGHYDVAGNAWQWTEDHFHPLPGFAAHAFYDDFSTPCFDGRHHMIMGGSYASSGDLASVHARFHFRPHFLQHSGFRLVSQADGACPATLLAATFEEAQAAAVALAQAQATAAASAHAHAAILTVPAAPNAAAAPAPKAKVSGTGVNLSSGGDTPVYETQALLDMYLGLHFPASGAREGVAPMLPHSHAPHHGLRFPQRVAQLLASHAPLSARARGGSGPTRALDVGCAVGGASFELATRFDQVVGFDFSASFVAAAQAMQRGDEVAFTVPVEGDCAVQVTATHEPNVDAAARRRCSFHQGDAGALLPRHLAHDPLLGGSFDGAVVANLLCRLPNPRAFLDGLAAVLKPGGVAVVVTPYSWLEEFTAREQWLGGTFDPATGQPVAAKDVLTCEMALRGFTKVHEEQLPLVIREHQRKYQYIVSEATVWRKEK